ncbi:signal recognition particle-docking protein FtsY [Eubacterium minutum ATCC 700079]|nr:signal recognition particle-docking protein FtsY [Eubacterium minutum ATCC 700079]
MALLSNKKKGFFGRLSERISDAIFMHPKIDEDIMEELEEILITSDIGMDTTIKIMEDLRRYIKDNNLTETPELREGIVEIIKNLIDKGERNKLSREYPLVIMMIGINGGGKTTSIAKLGNRLKKENKSVIFAAADTFRAAAGEQLRIWGERIGVRTVLHSEGADPSAVLFDAIQAAKSKGTDVLIVDTAGRLQNKKNLMDELGKMNRIIDREFPEASRETLLVLDATNGKNAVSQAKEFDQVAEISGVMITKLDGTAKGGIAVTIADEFDMPIKFMGVGESVEDIEEFDAAEFAGGIINE